jgi:CRISPR-associated endonuclease/helicase Cas3
MMDYYKLWGKTDNNGNWHPLVCHMLDVAAVGKVWLENDPILLSIIKDNSGLSNCNDRDFIRFIIFIMALHDIGKATICFQNKIPEFSKEARIYDENRARLSFDHGLYGLYWISQYEKAKKQDKRTNSTKHMDKYLASIGGFSSIIYQFECQNICDLFIPLLKAAFWHHGSIYLSSQIAGGMQDESPHAPNYETVNSRRNELLVCISEFFEICNLKIVTQDKPSFALNRFFAGFVSVCDWIASSDDVFRSNFSFDLDEHFSVSREKGIVALKKYGLITDYTTIVNRSFVDFFGFSPRGVQRKIEDVLDENQSSFYIVEAPTGEGKSEAAFFTHYKTQNRGLYFALPSQATANQMYGRVISFLEKQMDQKTVTVLAHGFAWLSKEYKSHKQKSKKWDESSGYTSHDEWFFTKKKTLLATSGVGTVDQVMLSVLNTRHYFVKLFALAGKTLIIDEVHAYDYFMLPIIKQLLEWSYFLQINVILLSATLPAVMKKELLQGYTGDDTFCEKIFFESSYPLITTVDRKKNIKQYPVDSTRKKEEIGINLKKHKGDPSSIVNAVMDKIKSGGNVLWICNTVKRAQEVYSILANHKRQECELYLFHSRFTYSDRINKETTVTDLYGKGVDEKPNRNRPLKSILVATQVVEQSLDVDFDFIVTDIAPIDLLLQRFGRMHRHNKNNDNRPERVSQPHACVLVPEVDIEGPIKEKSGAFQMI